MTSRAGAWLLRGLTGLTLAFIYLPLLVIVLYAFNDKRSLVVADRRPDDEVVRAARSTTRACATRCSSR